MAQRASSDRLRDSAALRIVWLAVGCAVLVAVFCAAVAFGARGVSLSDIVGALDGDAASIGEARVVKRLPRAVLAILIGAALALSGAAMQAVTRNPLADPGILGVSNGAAFAVVTGMVFFGLTNATTKVFVAIIGASLAAIFVYSIGSLGRGGATPLKLALAGAATSAATMSLINALILPRANVLSNFRFWQIGDVGGASWGRIGLVAPFLAAGALICLATARGMNSLALGDDVARGLGENVGRTRALASVGAVMLCGAATAVAGPIGFVGLVVPHVCRLLIGVDHRWLLPFSALLGAALLVGADLVGRILVDGEQLDVGIVTPLIGAPFFIWIVRRQKVREL